MEVPITMIGIVFGGGVVVVEAVVLVAGFTMIAPPDDARDICCPPLEITDPGRRVWVPITTPDDI